MPSPLGHICGGVALYLAATRKERQSKLLLALTIFGSIAPDLDFLPGVLIGQPGAFHHGVSHSLSFAALFSALVFLSFRCFQPNVAIHAALLGASVYAFHIILDLVSLNEGGRGVPIFWPLVVDPFGLNLQIFGHFHHSGFTKGIWSVVRWDNVSALTRELLVTALPVLFLIWRRKEPSERTGASGLPR